MEPTFKYWMHPPIPRELARQCTPQSGVGQSSFEGGKGDVLCEPCVAWMGRRLYGVSIFSADTD
ncbi:MAG: hypothetical protein AMXMBFR82_53440 [Candidatus Hydrogenedentota bacterium]